METKQQIIDRLKGLGYETIFEYDDPAGEYFSEHTHDGEQRLVVIRGGISSNMDGKQYTLGPADELVFPQRLPHDATVGPEGCYYIVGEKKPI